MFSTRLGWTLALTASAWFLFALDRLVVATALPAIRSDLGADLAGAQWVVDAYTLAFAVLLLTGAALGDRFGRRRMFAVGLAVFTAGSAAAVLAPSIGVLVAARAVQGAGAALAAPVALTLLGAATPARRRGTVLGAWGAIGGLGAALGPLVGGGLTEAIGWPWIFAINVALGLALVPLARRRLVESTGPSRPIDARGIVLSGVGLFGVVWAVIRAGGAGARTDVAVAGLAGATLLVLFVVAQRRTQAPMLPLRFFRSRAFTAATLASVGMYAALFGGVFLIAQLFQTTWAASPWQAGLWLFPMAVMPMLLAPVGGLLGDRIGARPVLATGAAMVASGLAWTAYVAGSGSYAALVPALVVIGAGSGLFFAPVAAVLLSAVAPDEQGQASGAAGAVRELAAVLGVAVLGAVLAGHTGTGAAPAAGAALWLGAGIAAAGSLAALVLPRIPTPQVVRQLPVHEETAQWNRTRSRRLSSAEPPTRNAA
jgi:EmrB/QacA subfamily drug resistance transporter